MTAVLEPTVTAIIPTQTPPPAGDVAVYTAQQSERASYDPTSGVIRVPTHVTGVHLTFTPGQTVLNEAQMVLLSPLGVEAKWDPRVVATFLMECLERGLDPWQREAYLMLYAGKYIRHIGIDGFRMRGESSGEYRGRRHPLFCGDDERWREVWPYKDVAPMAAKVGISRAGFDDVQWNVAHYDEFGLTDERVWNDREKKKLPTGKLVPTSPNWAPAAKGGKPCVMLGKCAEAGAWRVAFPRRFGGFYAPEEFDRVRAQQGDDSPAAAARRTAYSAAQTAAPERERIVVDGSTVDVVATPADGADADLLLRELDEQAEVLGKTVAQLSERWSASRGGQDIHTATGPELLDLVHRIRPYVVTALREQNRDDEADRYEQAPTVAPVRELFGRGPAILDPADEVEVQQ